MKEQEPFSETFNKMITFLKTEIPKEEDHLRWLIEQNAYNFMVERSENTLTYLKQSLEEYEGYAANLSEK